MTHSALNAWERIREIGKKSELFTEVMQSPKEDFTDLLPRLTSAVNRMIPNSEGRHIIIESLAFETINYLCKRIIRQLKARSAPLDE